MTLAPSCADFHVPMCAGSLGRRLQTLEVNTQPAAVPEVARYPNEDEIVWRHFPELKEKGEHVTDYLNLVCHPEADAPARLALYRSAQTLARIP